MFVKRIFLLVFLGLLVPLFCSASFNLDSWKYFQEIDFSQDGLIKFELNREVFLNSQKDLADLRLADQKSREVPYYLAVSRDSQKVESYSPRLLNNTFVKGKYSSVILDTGEKEKIINRLGIITDSENFQRNVQVQASNDRNNWQTLLTDGYIYDYTDEKGELKAGDTQLDFSDSAFRYYKIEISDPEGEPVKIKDAKAFYYEQSEQNRVEYSPDYKISENREERKTEVLIDLGGAGIPVREVEFSFSQENFHRGVYVYAGRDKKDWKFKGNGYIFRYNTSRFQGEKLKLNFSRSKTRYLKVVIDNKDNTPLTLKDLRVFYPIHRVYFQADPGKSYRLYYGNSRAEKVEYDLEKYFPYLDKSESVEAQLSGQKENGSFVTPEEKKPLTERIPYLLPGSLLVLCAVLLFLVFKFLKK